MTNPLILNFGLPHFLDIKPEHVKPAVDWLFHWVQDKQKQLEKTCETKNNLTWKNLILPLEEINLAIHGVWGPLEHLQSVANSPHMRTVFEECQSKIVEMGLMLAQSQPLFQAFQRYQESPEWDLLSQERKRIITQKIFYAKLQGMGLEKEKLQEFNKIEEDLNLLELKFANHLLDSTKEFKMVLKTEEEIKGLPEFLLEQYAYASGTHTDPKKGPWLVTLDLASYGPFMEYSKRRDLREHIYRAYITKSSSGSYDNTPLILEILKLRKRKAHILEFETFADLSLAQKMAQNKTKVYDFLDHLKTASRPKAKKDLEELKKRQPDLKNWDIAFLSRQLKEERFSFSEEELKPYFSLETVLEGLFSLAYKLFNIRIEKVLDSAKKPQVWHKDVQYFLVYSAETHAELAGFFLDPYSRPENKRGGAWMNTCINKHVYQGKQVNPIAYLVCNSTPPTDKKPSLLTFPEVETLFHEFGHGLQHMLTLINDLDSAGIENIEWDAVELPSQFMENWCYHEPTLMSFAKHFETRVSMPKELYEKNLAAKNFQSGLQMIRQLQFSLVDLALHDRFDPEKDDLLTFQKQIIESLAVILPLPEDRSLCSFAHIFAGGYSAGYYSYKWAEVLSADAFGAFEEQMDSLNTIGQKFRETILGLGGSKPAMEVFKLFRGREPEIKALLRHNDL